MDVVNMEIGKACLIRDLFYFYFLENLKKKIFAPCKYMIEFANILFYLFQKMNQNATTTYISCRVFLCTSFCEMFSTSMETTEVVLTTRMYFRDVIVLLIKE